MPAEDYRHVRKGGLKLKKSKDKTGQTTKEKRRPDQTMADVEATAAKAAETAAAEPSGVTDGQIELPTGIDAELDNVAEDIKRIMAWDHLTSAEKSFQLARHMRRKERIEKRLSLTHRERMAQFNSQLAKLSEHFDIPKVGPG